ncbi:hypothetical protein VTK56DRAFT_1989 [Thermocarpiscus australiensis]
MDQGVSWDPSGLGALRRGNLSSSPFRPGRSWLSLPLSRAIDDGLSLCHSLSWFAAKERGSNVNLLCAYQTAEMETQTVHLDCCARAPPAAFHALVRPSRIPGRAPSEDAQLHQTSCLPCRRPHPEGVDLCIPVLPVSPTVSFHHANTVQWPWNRTGSSACCGTAAPIRFCCAVEVRG